MEEDASEGDECNRYIEVTIWSFFILYNNQQMYNYFTNYCTPPTCFDTTVSSSASL
jgi:hypothetical protein